MAICLIEIGLKCHWLWISYCHSRCRRCHSKRYANTFLPCLLFYTFIFSIIPPFQQTTPTPTPTPILSSIAIILHLSSGWVSAIVRVWVNFWNGLWQFHRMSVSHFSISHLYQKKKHNPKKKHRRNTDGRTNKKCEWEIFFSSFLQSTRRLHLIDFFVFFFFVSGFFAFLRFFFPLIQIRRIRNVYK